MKNYILIVVYCMSSALFSHVPIVIAHRGASGYEPENTLRSFKRALEMGAPMVELDVFVCKSGELVVIHDETIDRTTNGHGNVTELSLDILKKFDAGKGECIPLLSNVFDLVNKKAIIDIELKGPHTAKPVAKLIKHYITNNNWSSNSFMVTSFDLNLLQEFHNYLPHIKIGALFEKANNSVEITKQLGADYVIVDYTYATEGLINKAHAAGLKVFAYTVNNKAEAQRLAALKIDGIFSNYPDIFTARS